MRPVLFLSFILFNLSLYAQEDTQYWYFGKNAGIKFSKKVCSVKTDGKLYADEGTGTITLKSGAFFYSDGQNIFNRNHNKVSGIQLNSQSSSTQGVLMLQHPDNDSILFIFTNSETYQPTCPSYYYELLILNDTNLILRKQKLLELFGSEKITACNHKNNRDIWIVSHLYHDRTFTKYLLTNSGLVTCSPYQDIGTDYLNDISGYPAGGQMKFSNTSNLLVSTTWAFNNVDLFKFNSETGSLSDFITLEVLVNFGVEFSKSNQYLYVSDRRGNLTQFCLKHWNVDSINNSRRIITSMGGKVISSLQIAPDDRIYWSLNDSSYLASINFPDKSGDSCELNFRQIYLNGKKCAAGLPTFNQSDFYTPSIDFEYEMNCLKNSVQFFGKDTFKASSYSWLIKKKGKPAEGNYTSKNISHTFSDTGKYEVRYIASKGNRQDSVIKTITIHPKINKQFLGNDTVYAQGTSFNKILKAPIGMHCQFWQDSSTLNTFTADSAGIYVCKVINQSFCVISDTVVIRECINNLIEPSIYRNKDTLFAYHQMADSFVWFLNGKFYKTTKSSFIKLTDTGTYRVEAAKKDYCNRSSVNYHLKSLAIDRITLEDLGIAYYPNPTSGTLYFKSEKPFEVRVYDLTGRLEGTYLTPNQINLEKGMHLIYFKLDEINIIEMITVI